MDARHLFQYLIGCWLIEKNISGEGILVGNAHFLNLGNNTALYSEEIKFLKNKIMIRGHAQHKYFIKNNDLYIQFMNQKKSFRLDMSDKRAYGIYNCGKDIYKIVMDFLNIDNFSTICEISGGKNCKITTIFKKIK